MPSQTDDLRGYRVRVTALSLLDRQKRLGGEVFPRRDH